MNPPFARNADIAHVRAAFDLLRPGGRLVAVMSNHHTFARESAAARFRAWLEDVGGQTQPTEQVYPAGFRPSGTLIQTVIVVLDR